MRVRVLKKTSSYWNYSVQTFEPGDELDGDLARHLADNAPKGSIEVLEDDRPAKPGPDSGDTGNGKPPADPVAGDLDINASASVVLAWVGNDPERAVVALAAESAKDSPRSTLVKQLDKLVAVEDPGPGQE